CVREPQEYPFFLVRLGRHRVHANFRTCVSLFRYFFKSLLHFKAGASVEPRSAGVSTVRMPAAFIAAYLSFAVPCPPEMMAPAWPMRRAGGAVCPAMKPTTGFFMLALIQAAAVSSASPPISPIRITALVSGSSLKSLMASRKEV